MASVSFRDIHMRSMDRALRAVELRRQGLTFREIGLQIGCSGPVTVETARQAVKKGERILRARQVMADAGDRAMRYQKKIDERGY